jgi:hypothetical protein
MAAKRKTRPDGPREKTALRSRPDPNIKDISDIWRYAIGLDSECRGFDGYAYAKKHFGVECGDLANQRLESYRKTGKWTGSFEELRCCLFFEQRRYHHFGWNPEGEELEAIKALYQAICDRWTDFSIAAP